MIKGILILLSMIVSPETAIIILRKEDSHFLLTLLATEIVSCLGILLTYGIFSGVFWFFSYLIKKINFVGFRKGNNTTNRRVRYIRILLAIFKRELRRKISKALHKNKFLIQHLILISLNLVPIPFLTTSTVFIIKISKLKNGIYSILVGNFLKVLIVTIFFYRYL